MDELLDFQESVSKLKHLIPRKLLETKKRWAPLDGRRAAAQDALLELEIAARKTRDASSAAVRKLRTSMEGVLGCSLLWQIVTYQTFLFNES